MKGEIRPDETLKALMFFGGASNSLTGMAPTQDANNERRHPHSHWHAGYGGTSQVRITWQFIATSAVLTPNGSLGSANPAEKDFNAGLGTAVE